MAKPEVVALHQGTLLGPKGDKVNSATRLSLGIIAPSEKSCMLGFKSHDHFHDTSRVGKPGRHQAGLRPPGREDGGECRV